MNTYHGAGVAGSDTSKAPGRDGVPCLAVTNFVCSRGMCECVILMLVTDPQVNMEDGSRIDYHM